MAMTIAQALEAFISDNNGRTFEQAVKDATTAGFSGSGYAVELFEDGTFRVLWNGQIGNLYASPGLILGIPQFGEETISDWAEYGENTDLWFALEEAEAALREGFQMAREVK